MSISHHPIIVLINNYIMLKDGICQACCAYHTVKKKRGDCHKKPVNKQFIEDFIVHETMKEIRDDKVIQAIVSSVMDMQEQENTQLPLSMRAISTFRSRPLVTDKGERWVHV